MTQRGTSLEERVDQVLAELRVILPGTQAILGFQLVAVFSAGFERLEASSKYVHFTSLLLICLTAALLVMPAAYHRIVYRGRDTEELHGFASAIVLCAMATLALGMATDLFVIARMILGGVAPALAVGGASLLVFFTAWFGIPLLVRSRTNR